MSVKIEKFEIDDLTMSFRIHPNGGSSANCIDGYASLYFCAQSPHAMADDDRRLLTRFQCKDKAFRCVHNVADFYNDNGNKKYRGYHSPFRSCYLKSMTSMTITITLYHDAVVVPKINSFFYQLTNMHKLSRKNGDITLVVRVNQNADDEGESDLYVPPSKKQKRNHNKNENNLDSNSNHNNESELKMSSMILRTASPVFDSMLSSRNNMLESQQKKIIVHAKSVKDVEDMLWFMSTNKLKSDCNALSLIQLAHFYQMELLVSACANRMIQSLSIKNCIAIITIFDKYGIEQGYERLIDFAKENINKLKKADNYSQLSHAFRCGILGKP